MKCQCVPWICFLGTEFAVIKMHVHRHTHDRGSCIHYIYLQASTVAIPDPRNTRVIDSRAAIIANSCRLGCTRAVHAFSLSLRGCTVVVVAVTTLRNLPCY